MLSSRLLLEDLLSSPAASLEKLVSIQPARKGRGIDLEMKFL